MIKFEAVNPMEIFVSARFLRILIIQGVDSTAALVNGFLASLKSDVFVTRSLNF
jgi:hypothetical protein